MERRRLHGRVGLLHPLVRRAADQGIARGMSLLQYRRSLNLVAECFCTVKRQHSQMPVSWLTNTECVLRAQGGCRSWDCVRLVEDGLRDGANGRCGGPRVFDGGVMREAPASLAGRGGLASTVSLCC